MLVIQSRFAVVVIAVLTLVSCVSAAQEGVGSSASGTGAAATVADVGNNAGAATVPHLESRDLRYRVSAGDAFDINFELSPEFNQTAVTIQPDGFITLRGVGDMKVEGETVPELTQTVRMAYQKILHDPIVSLVLKDFEKPFFIANGQVGKPGRYDLRGQITLTEAIAIAGGFTKESKHSQVLLFRRLNDQWSEAKILNVKKMEKSGNLAEDPLLHPGDMLFVPKNTFSKVEHFIPNAQLGSYFPIP